MNKKFKKMQITCRGIVCGNTHETRHHCALKKSNGITLIALVITIIILLILAGVTLNIVFNGGLMDKAQNSVDQYADKAQNETELLDYIDKKFGQYVTVLDNINGTENKKVIESTEIGQYYNPIVPVGFKTVNTEKASWDIVDDSTLGKKVVRGWNDGLVIEDSQGNQFVWVPAQIISDGEAGISGVVEYKKWCTTGIAYNDSSIKGDDLPSDVIETYQIETYGGFYIGRYEASEPISGTVPQTQNDKAPWTDINYTNSKNYAESYKNNENVKSGLLTGQMWDTALAWIDTNVKGYSTITNKGNYSGIKINTGKTTSDTVNNICDLAGNVREWTGEQYSINRVRRAGDYKYGGVPAFRDNDNMMNSGSVVRF